MNESEVLSAVRTILNKHLNCSYRLYLFGSRSTKKNTEFSDFDYLIDIGKKIEGKSWSKIKSDIEDLNTLYSIDITDYHDITDEFLKSIEGDLRDVS